MNNHGCEKCEAYQSCNHVRVDLRDYDAERELGYYVTYIGGHAVVSGILHDHADPYVTMVMCVGFRSVGDILDDAVDVVNHRVLYDVKHPWEYFVDTHESVCMGLREQMLVLSK